MPTVTVRVGLESCCPPNTTTLSSSRVVGMGAGDSGRFSGLSAAEGGASGQPFKAGNAPDVKPLPQPVSTGFLRPGKPVETD